MSAARQSARGFLAHSLEKSGTVSLCLDPSSMPDSSGATIAAFAYVESGGTRDRMSLSGKGGTHSAEKECGQPHIDNFIKKCLEKGAA